MRTNHSLPTGAGAVLVAFMIGGAAMALAAEASSKCSAAKMRCVAKHVTAHLRCHQLAAVSGVDAATDSEILSCFERAGIQFDGDDASAKGCFEKAEARASKGNVSTTCPTTGDAAAMDARADAFVNDVLNGLDLATPRFEDTGLTIRDHATGLEWEKKTADGGLHDAYTFHSFTDPIDDDLTDPDGTAFTVFLAALNACTTSDAATVGGGFAGHCDWRVPQLDELLTIVDLDVPGCGLGSPCIDPIFGTTAADGHLSATAVAGNPTHARGVNFEQGAVGFGEKDDLLYVRAVRGVFRRPES